ncbi:hypothetical protein ODJ79_40070 [Actinoplanes sp. KI2]|uniref:hypothetical protein n=1 Tax=Actinoplanes sp. KI2 TaxID=2983315 RepID=UPI0021D60290|nr:hypothetical protein [Actinoplanes sp. KI2]MCU7729951.1 hypothetical protein [Actinoplanes sp. KI2]
MTKSRRRSRLGKDEPEPEEPAATTESQEPPPAVAKPVGRGRRRSLRAGQPSPAGVREQPPPAGVREQPRQAGEREQPPPPQPSAESLSGRLPPGEAAGTGLIATEAGRYLRQAARDEAPSRFGSPTGEVDESARRVWEIAFGLAVRRRFEPDAALAEISRTVAIAVHDHAVAGLPVLDTEMLVRAALGETVPTGDIDDSVVIAVHLLLFASLADELALGNAEVDAIIAEAEEKASALMTV